MTTTLPSSLFGPSSGTGRIFLLTDSVGVNAFKVDVSKSVLERMVIEWPGAFHPDKVRGRDFKNTWVYFRPAVHDPEKNIAEVAHTLEMRRAFVFDERLVEFIESPEKLHAYDIGVYLEYQQRCVDYWKSIVNNPGEWDLIELPEMPSDPGFFPPPVKGKSVKGKSPSMTMVTCVMIDNDELDQLRKEAAIGRQFQDSLESISKMQEALEDRLGETMRQMFEDRYGRPAFGDDDDDAPFDWLTWDPYLPVKHFYPKDDLKDVFMKLYMNGWTT